MSKKCTLCGAKVGFFSGEFIAEKYVCKACYEAHLEKNKGKEEESDHTWLLLSESFKNIYKYKPWSKYSDKQKK